MGQYTIEDKQLHIAIMELMIDVLANQSALAELMLRQMAAGDEEKFQYLSAALDQNTQAQWHRLFAMVSTRYAALPVEIWEELQKSKSGE